MSVSVRAKRFWDKLIGYYGTALTDQFGETPQADWCEVIDDADNDTAKAALAEIRQRHVNWPPKFPEFEAIFAKLQRPQSTGPSTQELLCDYVVRNYTLTRHQLAAPWTYLYRGHPGFPGGKASPDFGVCAVVIPADGDSHGLRVSIEDMQMGNAA